MGSINSGSIFMVATNGLIARIAMIAKNRRDFFLSLRAILRFLRSSVFQKVFSDGRQKRRSSFRRSPVGVSYSSAGSAARMYSITESLQPSMCTHLP
jgi:hypothetical protein